jgi:hypothetical protein
MSDLPKFEVGNDAAFTQRINEFIQNLDLADKLNVYSLLDIDEDTYQIKGYKEDALQIIKDILAIHLHDKGTVLNPDIDFLRAKVGFFDSQLQEVQGQEILEYVKSKGIEEKILLYALDKDHEIAGIDPVKWAIDNDLRINGKKAIEWAVKNDLEIDGKLALEWAFINDKTIGGKQAMEFATINNVNVGGVSVMDWVDKNADRLIAAKDGTNREVVGEHTRRVSKQQSTTKAISVGM